MKLEIFTGLAAVVTILAFVFITQRMDSAPKSARQVGSYNVVHADNYGCPEGWTFTGGLFVAKDGIRRDGCVGWRNITTTGKVTVEYLEPGETADMPIAITRKGEDQ